MKLIPTLAVTLMAASIALPACAATSGTAETVALTTPQVDTGTGTNTATNSTGTPMARALPNTASPGGVIGSGVGGVGSTGATPDTAPGLRTDKGGASIPSTNNGGK